MRSGNAIASTSDQNGPVTDDQTPGRGCALSSREHKGEQDSDDGQHHENAGSNFHHTTLPQPGDACRAIVLRPIHMPRMTICQGSRYRGRPSLQGASYSPLLFPFWSHRAAGIDPPILPAMAGQQFLFDHFAPEKGCIRVVAFQYVVDLPF